MQRIKNNIWTLLKFCFVLPLTFASINVSALEEQTVNAYFSPSSITEGESTKLIWSSNNQYTSKCDISGLPGTLNDMNFSGSINMVPNGDKTVTVTCGSGWNKASKSAVLKVEAAPPASHKICYYSGLIYLEAGQQSPDNTLPYSRWEMSTQIIGIGLSCPANDYVRKTIMYTYYDSAGFLQNGWADYSGWLNYQYETVVN